MLFVTDTTSSSAASAAVAAGSPSTTAATADFGEWCSRICTPGKIGELL